MVENKKNGHNLPKVNLLIREIMKKKGVSVEQLGNALGITRCSMDNKIKYNITINSLYDIAQVLECEIADFFPVPDGYEHWTKKEESPSQSPLKEEEGTAEEGHDVFCPRCGAKFRMY